MQPPEIDLSNGSAFLGDTEWNEKIKEALKAQLDEGGRPRRPRVSAGTICASDRLIKDPELAKHWKSFVRKVQVVEMEASGVLQAVDRETPVLVVRGISDIVGYKREGPWTAYACNTVATFVDELLRSGHLREYF